MDVYKLSDVKKLTGMTTTDITMSVRAGTFPDPFIDDGKFRWRKSDVDQWVKDNQALVDSYKSTEKSTETSSS